MDVISLHPFDPEIARRYVAALGGEIPPDPEWDGWWNDDLRRVRDGARAGDERALNRLTLGLAWALGSHYPAFFGDGFGLTVWEARIDRGVGMLMRPPSRLFTDAGLDTATARGMPIRLDLEAGLMGGAYVPARLIGDVEAIIERHLDRTVRRLAEAGYDPARTIALLTEAVAFARSGGLGLYEAMDAIGPDGEAIVGSVVVPDPQRLSRPMRQRIAAAQRQPKGERRSLLDRLLQRPVRPSPSPNGYHPDDREQSLR